MVRHPEIAAPGPMMPVSLPSSPDVPDDKERRALQLLIVDDDVAKFAGSVIVISGMDAAHRSAARSYARSLGIDLQSLPKPVDLAALRICLANLGKTAMGLPVVHTWGGVAADSVAARHRS